jgi:putative flippase GtrA
MIARLLRFNLVSLSGVFVQLCVFWVLLHLCGLDYLAAGLLGVAGAIAHNFAWHRRWTWVDRPLSSPAVAFCRFAGGNGVVSLVANVLAMPLLVERIHMRPLPAILVTIALGGLVNFWLADWLAFRAAGSTVSSSHAEPDPAPHGASPPAHPSQSLQAQRGFIRGAYDDSIRTARSTICTKSR